MRKILSICSLLLLVTLYGCENTSYNNSYSPNDIKDSIEEKSIDNSGISNIDENITNQNNEIDSYLKLVYKANISIETLDFDNTYLEVHKLIEKYQGFIASEQLDSGGNSYLYNQYRGEYEGYREGKVENLVIRVPSKNYKQLINEYSNIGNIIYKNQYVENITDRYNNTESTVNALKKQLNRLNELLNNTDKIEDMIKLTKEISSLESEISRNTNDLNIMNKDIDYSYVNLTIREVKEYTKTLEKEKTNKFIDRLKNRINQAYKNTLSLIEYIIFFSIDLFPLLIVGLIAFIIYLIHKLHTNKKIKNIKKEKIIQNNMIMYLTIQVRYIFLYYKNI